MRSGSWPRRSWAPTCSEGGGDRGGGGGGTIVVADERRGGELAQDPARPRAGALARRDGALVRDAQRGSADALEELFRRHWRRAHRAAYLVVGDASAAEDIAQESFLAAIRALDRFDRRRPFAPWLHRIAVNRAIDYARARALRAARATCPTSTRRRLSAGRPRSGRPRRARRDLG